MPPFVCLFVFKCLQKLNGKKSKRKSSGESKKNRHTFRKTIWTVFLWLSYIMYTLMDKIATLWLMTTISNDSFSRVIVFFNRLKNSSAYLNFQSSLRKKWGNDCSHICRFSSLSWSLEVFFLSSYNYVNRNSSTYFNFFFSLIFELAWDVAKKM